MNKVSTFLFLLISFAHFQALSMEQNFGNMVKNIKLYMSKYLSDKELVNLSSIDKKHGEIFKCELTIRKENKFEREALKADELVEQTLTSEFVEENLNAASEFIEKNVLNKERIKSNKKYFYFIDKSILTGNKKYRNIGVKLLVKLTKQCDFDAMNSAKTQLVSWKLLTHKAITPLVKDLTEALDSALSELTEIQNVKLYNELDIYEAMEMVKYFKTQKSKTENIIYLSDKILRRLTDVINHLDLLIKDLNIDAMNTAKNLIEHWGQAKSIDTKALQDILIKALTIATNDLVRLIKEKNEIAIDTGEKLVTAWEDNTNKTKFLKKKLSEALLQQTKSRKRKMILFNLFLK